MKIPFLILAVAFVGAGFLNKNATTLNKGARPTEKWLEDMIPTEVAGFKLDPSVPGGKISARMDQATYEELDPVGITTQRFDGPDGKKFEAVIVAGDSMRSFHDQRWCFHAQGWEILEETYTTITTKAYGEIPVSLVKIGRANSAPSYSIFTFRGPAHFHSTVFSLSKDYFLYELFKQKKFVGYEYRFIPGWSNATKDDLKKFAADYIDTCHQTSKGVL